MSLSISLASVGLNSDTPWLIDVSYTNSDEELIQIARRQSPFELNNHFACHAFSVYDTTGFMTEQVI